MLPAYHPEPDLDPVRLAYDERTAPEERARRRRAVEGFVARRLPLEEYVRELALLGLKGEPHLAEDYVRALSEYREVPIFLTRIGAPGDDSFVGRTEYGPAGITIRIPPRIKSWWLYQYTAFHEAGHVAADHPPRFVRGGTAPPGELRLPRKRLARRPPVEEGLPEEALLDLYEAEADLRAEYAMLTSSLGPAALEAPKLNQVS